MEVPFGRLAAMLLVLSKKQIDQIIASAKPGQPLTVKTPHSRFELFMDGIFLRVIRHHPALAPQIFTAMADRLTKDLPRP